MVIMRYCYKGGTFWEWELRKDGYIVSRVSTRLDSPEEVCVLGLTTEPQFRRQGYATALLQHVLQYHGEQGVDVAWLMVTTGNPARELYRKLGFREVADPDGYVCVMKKKLQPRKEGLSDVRAR